MDIHLRAIVLAVLMVVAVFVGVAAVASDPDNTERPSIEEKPIAHEERTAFTIIERADGTTYQCDGWGYSTHELEYHADEIDSCQKID